MAKKKALVYKYISVFLKGCKVLGGYEEPEVERHLNGGCGFPQIRL